MESHWFLRCALHRVFDAGVPPNFFALPLALLEERVPLDVLEQGRPLLLELRELLLLRLLFLEQLEPDLERDRDPLREHEPLLLPLMLRLPFLPLPDPFFSNIFPEWEKLHLSPYLHLPVRFQLLQGFFVLCPTTPCE